MKKIRHNLRFYSLIVALDVAVGVMLYTVNIPAPVLAAPQIAIIPQSKKAPAAITGTPTRIVIASIGLDLPVGVGSYNPNTGGWTLSNNKAYYADISLPANNSNGTTLIYGHNRSSVFSGLIQLHSGAKATVYTGSGYVFTYKYRSVNNVAPTDTTIITENGPPKLLLQTCAGLWDQYRAMYSFSYESEKKI